MTDVTGIWDFNANGSPGTLTINSQDPQGELIVSAQFQDRGNIEETGWTGVWDESLRQISLTRALSNNLTQAYTGYLGSNHPEIALIFGGSFIASDAVGLQFGWYARYKGPIRM